MHALLRACRRYVFFASLLFLAGFLTGYYVFSHNPLPHDGIVAQVVGGFRHMGERLDGLSFFRQIAFVFWNNARVILLALVAGAFFGIPPIVVAFMNGFFIGAISGNAALQGINVLAFLLSGVLPHGIFEIPAFILGVALSIRLGFNLLAYQRGGCGRDAFGRILRSTLVLYLVVVLPLLLVGSVVEMSITRSLVRWVLGTSLM